MIAARGARILDTPLDRLAALLVLLLVLMSVAARAQDGPAHVYLSSGIWAFVLEVDVATGDRRLIDLNDYPRIIKATDVTVEPSGTLLVETVGAIQSLAIFRVDPATGLKTGVSGAIKGDTLEMRGEGPSFAPSLNTMLCGERGELIVLRDLLGPMRVDLATGDRTIIAQSADPPVGEGHEFTKPIDMVIESGRTLLVSDEFDGLVRIHRASGNRSLDYPVSDFQFNPRRIDLLADGRLVYSLNDPDVGAIYAFDLAGRTNTLLSGSFGGNERGAGEPLVSAGDLTVDYAGNVWVYDPSQAILFRIDPATGDRALISGPERGEGDLLAWPDRPVLAVKGPNRSTRGALRMAW